MTMATEVTDRIPNDILVQVTNDDPAILIIDAAKLDTAIGDVISDFEIWAGAVLDATTPNPLFIGVAVDGVYLKLLAYKRQTSDIERYENWRQEYLVEGIKKVSHNNRVTPVTTSRLTPTRLPQGVNNRPWFDPNSAFNGLIPGQSGLRPSVEAATGAPGT